MTYRSAKNSERDGTRLRCSSHGAEFSVEDGSPVITSIAPCGLEPVPVHVDSQGRVVVGSQA